VTHINKPLELRTALGLTPTQAGRLAGFPPATAYSTWSKMERDNQDAESLSNVMRQYINLIYFLMANNPDLLQVWIKSILREEAL
jgi:hypothetical protein